MSLFQRLKRRLAGKPAVESGPLPELGRVVSDASRCVQCGVCGYNCPVGIPVRDYARQGLSVDDPTCISCGACIAVCPRGTLRWETSAHTIVLEHWTQPGRQSGSQEGI